MFRATTVYTVAMRTSHIGIALALVLIGTGCSEPFSGFAGGTSSQGGSAGGGGAGTTSWGTGGQGASTTSAQGGATTTSSSTSSSSTVVCDEIPKPMAGACPEICTTCEQGTCNIELDQLGQYQNKTLVCPPNMHCYVHCAANDSCKNAQIQCPEMFACKTKCSGDWSCENAQVHCGMTGVCTLACGSGTKVCKNTNLECGLQKCQGECSGLTDPLPLVHCNEACECYEC